MPTSEPAGAQPSNTPASSEGEPGLVTVYLHADLARGPQRPSGRAARDMPAQGTVRDLLQSLGLPPDRPVIIAVNQALASPDHLLQPGERVDVLPPLEGG